MDLDLPPVLLHFVAVAVVALQPRRQATIQRSQLLQPADPRARRAELEPPAVLRIAAALTDRRADNAG